MKGLHEDFTRFRPWVMWFLPSLFFAYQFIVRIIPGLVMPELMQKFRIDATSYGLFASIYYVGYAGIQIPLAILLDRYNPRIIISSCALLCALGTIILVYANHWSVALISRFLIGVGSAAGFLGTSKMVILWFQPKLYSKMIALNCTIGLMGAVYAGRPISTLISLLGWEKVLLMVGIVGFGITFLLAALIRNPPHMNLTKQDNSIFKNLKKVLCDTRLIIAALANLLMVGALEGFADVWGVSYLVITREISKSDAAFIISSIFLGMVCGGPILAYISDKLKAIYGVTSSCGFLIGIIFFVVFFLNVNISNSELYGLFFIVGILCSYQVLVFSIGASLVSGPLVGITVAFLNSINMLGGFFFHGIIGHSMDFFWRGNFENNIKIYNAETYTCALTVIPLAAIMGGWLFMLVGQKNAITTDIEGQTVK